MAQTPNVIGHLVIQRLKELKLPATPENYTRLYYEVAGLPPPPDPQPVVQNTPFCMELLLTLRDMAQELTDQADHLIKDLGSKNADLNDSVSGLKRSKEKDEFMRLLNLIVEQAGSIQDSVQSSHKELLAAR